MLFYVPVYTLERFPSESGATWERDVGTFEDEHWEEALQAVQLCSPNVVQRLSQLYIVLRVHIRLQGYIEWEYTRCSRDH